MLRVKPSPGLLALFLTATGYGQQSALLTRSPLLHLVRPTVDEQAQVFGRYLASIQEGDPFTESGLVDVTIEASLPNLAEYGSLVAIRRTAAEGSQYQVIKLDGGSTVKQQVIARYLDAEEQAARLPRSSVAVTPANYKFHCTGSTVANGAAAYVFQISPRKKRAGLIEGQIWIDSATGIVVHQAGRLVKRPSIFTRQVRVERDTSLRDGVPHTRLTHVVVETRLVGRAELTITERPFRTPNGGQGE